MGRESSDESKEQGIDLAIWRRAGDSGAVQVGVVE